MINPLDISIACELTGTELAARRQDILNNLLPKVEERKELPDGYAFRFPNTDEIARQLLDFILVERQCCSFFQIELAFSPEKGPAWLRLRGGGGIKHVMETELVSFTGL